MEETTKVESARIDHRAEDGGFASRKFWLSVLTSALIAACAFLSAEIPPLVGLFPTVSGALTAVLALYLGANVTMRHVQQKGAVAMSLAQDDLKPADPPKPRPDTPSTALP